jgi:2-methylisocitrate lyase-like PEP mutase family enzyme
MHSRNGIVFSRPNMARFRPYFREIAMAGPSVTDKRTAFRKLHESGCFVIPNPWDVGTTRYLQHLGFKALASTSAGFAFAQGIADGAVSRDMMLAHITEIAVASDLPVNADFEAGYAHDPAGVAESVRLCVETGVAGLSIEDSTGDAGKPLYDLDEAVARMRAARAAINKTDLGVLLTGRCEGFLVGKPDLAFVIERLRAYAAAGADVLYAPGIRTREQIEAVVKAVAPKPVNLLMPAALGFTVADIAAMGVRRISVGSTLARVAWTAFIRSAKAIADDGVFDSFSGTVPHAELNAFFRDDLKRWQKP